MKAASDRTLLRKVIAGAMAAAMVLSACGSESTETSNAEATEQAAPEISTLATVSGGQIDINDLEGTDTILWFWAPW